MVCKKRIDCTENAWGTPGDLLGSRRGSAGDPGGIRAKIGGSGHFEVSKRWGFGGIQRNQVSPFIILKKVIVLKNGNACGFRVNALVQQSRIVPANGCLEFYWGCAIGERVVKGVF